MIKPVKYICTSSDNSFTLLFKYENGGIVLINPQYSSNNKHQFMFNRSKFKTIMGFKECLDQILDFCQTLKEKERIQNEKTVHSFIADNC